MTSMGAFLALTSDNQPALQPCAWLRNVLILTRLLKRTPNWLASLVLQHKH